MNIRVIDIDSAVSRDIVDWCRGCVYWEHPEHFRRVTPEKSAELKTQWFDRTADEFGPCGKLLYVDDKPAAYCQFALPRFLPGLAGYGPLAGHVDQTAALVSCLCICEEDYRRKGLGRRLLQAVIQDLANRGFGAVQTIARDGSTDNCSGPTEFYLAQGFQVVAGETYPNGARLSLLRFQIQEATQ